MVLILSKRCFFPLFNVIILQCANKYVWHKSHCLVGSLLDSLSVIIIHINTIQNEETIIVIFCSHDIALL